MRKGTIIVTGGGGFIGSNIAADLAGDGHDVVVCDVFTHEESWEYLSGCTIQDLIEPGHLMDWLTDHVDEVSAIVHMGAISATTETDMAKIVANNVRLSLDLWEYASRNDTTFVYASSAATYGDGTAGFVDDDSPVGLAKLAPLNLYGWSKHFVDRRIASDATRGRRTPTRWAGLKFFNVYGPNERHKGPMRSVAHQLYPVAASGRPVKLFKSESPDYPDGGQLRDFIYVKDCCEMVRQALDAPRVAGIFNAGTGKARSFADLARAVFAAVGAEPRIEYIEMPAALRGRYQYFTQADTTRLMAAGLAPSFYELEEGVADYVTAHLVRECADLNVRG